MPSRLSTIAPDLAAWLEHQSRERLRGAAANAAHLAVERTRLTDLRLDAALTALRNGQFGGMAEQSRVQQLVDELDAAAWDLQEKAEVGTVPGLYRRVQEGKSGSVGRLRAGFGRAECRP
jgi:hypothetical protein